MANSDQTSRILNADVGNNRTNNPDDVLRVKKILSHFGLYDLNQPPEPHGYMTADADVAIRRFQGVKNLKVDGYMRPDGETEREMKKVKIPEKYIDKRYIDKLERYKAGTGEVLRYEPEDIDASPAFRVAMDDNKKRFEDSMVKGEVNGIKHPFKDQILRLRDGESIVLNNPAVDGGVDYWDQDIGANEGLRNFDVDQGLGIGRVKFRSTGSLKATRKGDKVLVDGLVDHRFNDAYDFNRDDNVFGVLRHIPGSKPFRIYGSKLEKLNGEVSLEHGTIKDHKFQWNDINEENIR